MGVQTALMWTDPDGGFTAYFLDDAAARASFDSARRSYRSRARSASTACTTPLSWLSEPTKLATNLVAGLRVDLCRGPDLDQPPLAHYCDPVGQAQRLVLVDESRKSLRTKLAMEREGAPRVPLCGLSRRRSTVVRRKVRCPRCPTTSSRQRNTLLLSTAHLCPGNDLPAPGHRLA